MSVVPSIWNVPYHRNPFFTGREDILKNLHNTLTAGKTAALTQPQAIRGLGGIGKTQTAVEYAYRYYNVYKAVLWAKADTREVLVTDFVSIADLLNLPEKNEQDQNKAVNAVKRWLQNHLDWLLILDNVEDLEMVEEFIPTTTGGHILLTTRTQATGTANNVDVHKMEAEEGALFLIRRAKVITLDAPLDSAKPADCDKAREVSQVLDGLPLALDQAGAYIEETACTLSEYLDLYQAQYAELLKDRGQLTFGHPESVVTTFSLAFEKVEQNNPAAAELLQLCAFLHPDDIPEEIITEGALDLSPVLQSTTTNLYQLKKSIAELLKYSLIHRDPETKGLSIHRLVQAVLKNWMDEPIERLWAERAVRAVSRTFPNVEYAVWSRCQRCLPHAQVCAVLIKQWTIMSLEAARLLDQAGSYLKERAQNAQAELMLQQSLAIYEKIWGPEHPDVAHSLNNLAEVYRQGKYAQAEPLYQRALAIWEQTLGPVHPYVAIGLNNLALLYFTQGKYVQAEPLFQRAISIWEKIPGAEDPHIANSLNSLAELYRVQGKYAQAEPLFQRALAIREQRLGTEHRHVSNSLNGLALLYHVQGRHAEAEPLFRRALAIREKVLGREHPAVAVCLNNLALLYSTQGKYTQAESLYQQALAIYKQIPGGSEHSDTATCLNNLARLYHIQGRYAEAEPLFRRALAIRKNALGSDHPNVATSLENYANLLRKTNREAEAAELEARAKAIRAQYTQKDQEQ